ncbi:hypothetical protein ACTWP5_15410 [Streptomyces sp. 4N509B]|uniref:hypothetical protein n=1 Tax=Streptomyces sp. 4N509B TaxID=3457413 RepID=UPI003FD356B5
MTASSADWSGADRSGTSAVAPLSVDDRVRAQAAAIAGAAFSVFLPLVLGALVVTSAWTGWVNVMAMHTYLDVPRALPGSMWAVPIAVQTFIIVGEATMVLNSVLRRRWIVASGAAAVAAGYGAEIGAHVYYGEAPDTIATMIVAAAASGGGWALVAALLDRGVQLANSGVDPERLPPRSGSSGRRGRKSREHVASGSESRSGRRTRRQLLDIVRALEPDRPSLSPNFVATRVGVSWANAKSLLSEVGRLLPPPQGGTAPRPRYKQSAMSRPGDVRQIR